MLNELNDRIIEIQDQQIKALEKCRELDAIVHEGEMSRATKRIKDLEGDVLHWSSEYEKQKELYEGAVQHVAAERDEAIALADELKKDVQHWQAQFDREHAAFEQAAEERDKAIRDKAELRRRLHAAHSELAATEEHCDKLGAEGAQLFTDHAKALEFINSIAEMIACDCGLSDITNEFIAWRRGEWAPTESIEDFVGQIVDEDDGSFFAGEELSAEEMLEDLSQYLEDNIEAEPDDDPYRYRVYVVEERGGERVFTGFFADYDLARESVDLMVARGCYEAWVEDKA